MNQKQSGKPAFRATTTMGADTAHDMATSRARFSRPANRAFTLPDEADALDLKRPPEAEEAEEAAATTPAAVTTASLRRGCHQSAWDHSATARRGRVSEASVDVRAPAAAEEEEAEAARRLTTHQSDTMPPSTEPKPEPTSGTQDM